MKIINHDAINLLFDKAEELSQEPHESWKCIYFKFSDKPEKNNHALYTNFVVSPITSLLGNHIGYIYLCDDGDIFILFQGALKPVVSRLSSHFGEIDPENPKESNDTFAVFDLSHQWREFHDLCVRKYYRKIVLSEEKRLRFTPANVTQRVYTAGSR